MDSVESRVIRVEPKDGETPVEALIRHFGKPEHAMNLPRLPVRITIGRPHFSHARPVSFGGAVGLRLTRTSLGTRAVFLQRG